MRSAASTARRRRSSSTIMDAPLLRSHPDVVARESGEVREFDSPARAVGARLEARALEKLARHLVARRRHEGERQGPRPFSPRPLRQPGDERVLDGAADDTTAEEEVLDTPVGSGSTVDEGEADETAVAKAVGDPHAVDLKVPGREPLAKGLGRE